MLYSVAATVTGSIRDDLRAIGQRSVVDLYECLTMEDAEPIRHLTTSSPPGRASTWRLAPVLTTWALAEGKQMAAKRWFILGYDRPTSS